MKKITLQQLSVRNFKGLEKLEINFDGKDLDIYGANETCKSTIVTAVNWLLSGKDEFNRQDFQIKNTVNRILNTQPHEVEAVFNVTGRGIIKVKRVYLEIWQKKKGQSAKEFTGHTTDFWFNDVPCNEKEFITKVSEAIIPADLIRPLTNPTHFNSLPWQDQRAALLKIAGEITNDQVINEIIKNTQDRKTDFATLNFVLSTGKSLEDYKKELAAKKLLLKKAGSEFIPRIDELKRNLTSQPVLNWEDIQADIEHYNILIADIDAQIENASKAAAAANLARVEKQRFLYKREGLLNDIKNRIRVEQLSKQQNKESELNLLQVKIKSGLAQLQQLKQQFIGQQQSINNYKQSINSLNTRIDKFRADWRAINAEKFVFNIDKCQCPTCGQQLPPETVEQKQDQLKTNFLTDQANRKNDLVVKSNQLKAEIAQCESFITKMQENNFAEDIKAENNNVNALEFKLKELQENIKPVNIDTAVEALVNVNEEALYLVDEIKALQAELDKGSLTAAEPDNTSLKEQKTAFMQQIEPLRNQLAQKDNIEYLKNRISKLMEEEKANAQAIADLENLEFDIETFTRAKMEVLEKRVNSMFEFVSFRLFEKQVNGGIAETCTAEYKGVPFATLNTAAKMLAGVDIIYTLSKFYKIAAPIFIDNRESVTFIPYRESQVISLYVSDQDKTLRITTPVKQIRKKVNHEQQDPETVSVTYNADQIRQQRDNDAPAY